MEESGNKATKEASVKAKKRSRKPVVVPYIPGFYCKYLVPDPFGTGR